MIEELGGKGEENSTQLIPEQRTEVFFNQDVLLLAEAMRGRVIVSQDDGKMIRVDNPEAWSVDRVGNRYTKSSILSLKELTPGTLGVFPLPVRRMRQSLISAKSGVVLGACVRLVRASSYDDSKGFVLMPREGDIANYFGLEDYETVRLRFVDDTGMLYFSRGEDNGVRVRTTELTETEAADQYLRGLLGQ